VEIKPSETRESYEIRVYTRLQPENLKGRENIVNLDVDWRKILTFN
jgi:hypothetical protein